MANTMSKYGSNTNRPLSEIVGLSTDTKPTDSIEGIQIQNGSSFRELDTGKRFLFDAENTTWNEVSSGGGGGGSTLIEKSISANGVYNASEDSADGYSKVTVNVSNTYTAQDEGKVVDNGALVAQTAMSSEVTENGTVDTTLYNSVTVNVPSGGGESQPRKDVNFYDYDGTIVNSYTAAEFAELTAMPANPSHDGLTSQGWNWSLADAKTYVATYGKLNIGQMYITSDGKTRLYINLLDDYKSPTLELYLNANSEVDVDWGDGSSHSTLSSTSAGYQSETHTYAVSGDYVITITVISGSININGNGSSFSLIKGNDSNSNKIYREGLYNIKIGSSVTSISSDAFHYCYSLTSITLPSTVTIIGLRAFSSCSSLTSITIPSGVTSIGNNTFDSCYSLTSITLPSTVTSIGTYAFHYCPSLTSITIPSGVTSIGNNAFYYCYSLTSITLPSTVTSIGDNAFYNCYSLTSITIPLSVTSISGSAFYNCYSLKYIYLLGTSLSGAPWGAPNTHTKVITLSRHNNYSDAENETQSGTELTTTINCNTNDLIIAAFVVRSSYSIPSDWNILTISDDIEASGTHQWTGVLYKVATETTETITISQSNAGRIYTTLIAIPSASIGTYSVFGQETPDMSITINKPVGLNVIVCSCILGEPNWSCIDDTTVLTSSTKRLGVLLDQTKEGKNTTISGVQQNAGLIATYITITGIDNFWYYDES